MREKAATDGAAAGGGGGARGNSSAVDTIFLMDYPYYPHPPPLPLTLLLYVVSISRRRRPQITPGDVSESKKEMARVGNWWIGQISKSRIGCSDGDRNLSNSDYTVNIVVGPATGAESSLE
jgi:hypothetical protein